MTEAFYLHMYLEKFLSKDYGGTVSVACNAFIELCDELKTLKNEKIWITQRET
jgi:hypothetical protein